MQWAPVQKPMLREEGARRTVQVALNGHTRVPAPISARGQRRSTAVHPPAPPAPRRGTHTQEVREPAGLRPPLRRSWMTAQSPRVLMAQRDRPGQPPGRPVLAPRDLPSGARSHPYPGRGAEEDLQPPRSLAVGERLKRRSHREFRPGPVAEEERTPTSRAGSLMPPAPGATSSDWRSTRR